MKRNKSVETLAGLRWKPSHFLLAAAALYLVFISFRFRHFLEIAAFISGDGIFSGELDRPVGEAVVGLHLSGSINHAAASSGIVGGDAYHRKKEDGGHEKAKVRGDDPLVLRARPKGDPSRWQGYGRITGEVMWKYNRTAAARVPQRRGNFTELEGLAHEAWALGAKAWAEAESYNGDDGSVLQAKSESCPLSLSMTAAELAASKDSLMFLPCGLDVGSSVTVVGTPQFAHSEYVPQLAKTEQGDGMVMVSQFMVELQGLKAVEGEEPPKILHLNPRLKGDWSKSPIIEHNTCYRMQWGKAMRCNGAPSNANDETVDGFSKCEKWEWGDTVESKETKTTSWLNRFIGRAKKPKMAWPFPFTESKLFVLTIQAGVEGYHIYVGGRHVSSFPYRTGFTLEDATGLSVKGDLDIHSVYATSLPTSHPSFSQQVLEMSDRWKSSPLPENPVHLFIGILSATNHFAERMAIRKTWMQYSALWSSNVVARFFVALGPRKEVNAALKKEADFFKDIVIVPFMDRYELVVLKTIAICQFGVQNLTAAYIMKCDDDTFVRVDVVLKLIDASVNQQSLYMGNLNLLHRPLRSGKWAVTYEEWPEEVYPPYANGPGYIISSDIARYVVSQRANHSLRLFKMEDVSMGMWVEEFNATNPVRCSHFWKFCQYGCMDNYYTSHYQSPKQMLCLWENLSHGRSQCCNVR